MQILDATATAEALPWPALIAALEATINDTQAGRVLAPTRQSLPLTAEAVWLIMPATSRRADIGVCKLVCVHPENSHRGLPTIQGDIIVIRASTGERLALLDGPAVTARRTAAITALAIRRIHQARQALSDPAVPGPPSSCLVIGCGVQGRGHLEALHAEWPGMRFYLHSRSPASAVRLAEFASSLGIAADVVPAPAAVLTQVDIVACCTPALEVCLEQRPREGAIITAVGSFTPEMSEIATGVMRQIGRNILLDSDAARHEAGELAQAGIDPEGLPTLLSWQAQALPAIGGTVLFKSCGSSLWDLAAAETALSSAGRPGVSG